MQVFTNTGLNKSSPIRIIKYIIYIYLSSPIFSFAQTVNTFNYNIYNGLPSNLVYGVLRDKLGYLWIATKKGVARYNGYDFRVFNQADGISNEDVWELCEDKKGGIWLSNISDEFGYIYNNKYHKAYVEGSTHTVYPSNIRAYEDGVVFFSHYINGDEMNYLCIENNDTIYKYNVSRLCNDKFGGKNNLAYTLINKAPPPLMITSTSELYQLTIDNHTLDAQRLRKLDDSVVRELGRSFVGISGDFMISYPVVIKANKFTAANLRTGKIIRTDLSTLGTKENINYVFFDIYGDMHFYVFTNDDILKFEIDSDTIKCVAIFNTSKLLGDPEVNASKIGTFHVDPFWGKCIGSTTNGLFLNYDQRNYFKKEENIDLRNYQNVGALNDSISFWWSGDKGTLAEIVKNGTTKYYKYETIKRVFNITHYQSDTFILNGVYNYYFDNRNGRLTKNNDADPNIHTMIIDSNGSSYAITITGFIRFNNHAAGNSPTQSFDHDRYRDLVYDGLRKSYWAYNFDRVCVHSKNQDTILGKEKFHDFGVRKIEKIAIDNKYGNFFFKGSDNITVYDWNTNAYQELFNNINVKESILLVHKNTFIVAGMFGVLFSKILGPGRISKPLYYPNLKNRNFSFVYDCAVLGGKVLLNTDKGTYSVNVPGDSEILNSDSDSTLYRYKFILYNDGAIRSFVSGDTLRLDQKDQRLQFDLVNPFGNGRPKYIYKLQGDTIWHDLNANELTLPSSLKPGNYYGLSIKAYDNVWRSDPTSVQLFIKPLWYQTDAGRRLVWAAVFGLALVSVSILILVTRHWVIKENKKRNMRMELELKSIYAQINPHFIFNTLNSALFFVSNNRMEEAYTHISKFSRLLRSYIKSSRNKLISIDEEIKNLKDYIELQQTRYQDRFDYIIDTRPDIESGSTMIPSLLLQPFVENAINHGLLLKKGKGMLRITFRASQEKNEVICVIEDNGVGRQFSKSIHDQEKNRETSYGDLLIKDLVSIFNKFEQMNIKITLADKELPLTGTIVTILIKKPHHGN